jgi:hypothetical protein
VRIMARIRLGPQEHTSEILTTTDTDDDGEEGDREKVVYC